MINIRPLEENDYEILCEWWKAWEWKSPPKEFLPDNGTGGMIVYDGKTPVCAAFLYSTNSAVCWLEFVISNKEYANKTNRGICLNLCLESLSNIARQSGFKYIYTVLKNESLIKAYESLGFIEGDMNIKTYIKNL